MINVVAFALASVIGSAVFLLAVDWLGRHRAAGLAGGLFLR